LTLKLCLKAKYVSEDPALRLRSCQQLGFGATQESAKSIPAAVSRGWPTPEEVRALKAPFQDAGVEVVALEPVKEPLRSWAEGTPEGRASFDVFARHLDAAGAAGIPCVTLHPPLDSPRSEAEAEEQFQRNCDFYRRAAAGARRAGTKLATHSPYGVRRDVRLDAPGRAQLSLTKPLWAGQAFGALFDAVPEPENGMIYCFGCMVMGAAPGSDPLAELPRFVRRTFFVHVRDVISHPDGSFAEVFPGQGDVRPDLAIRRLWQLGYRGPITPEHMPVLEGEGYAGPLAVGYAGGWSESVLNDLRRSPAA
jgi:sugar phosphate isomerase/epimerase